MRLQLVYKIINNTHAMPIGAFTSCKRHTWSKTIEQNRETIPNQNSKSLKTPKAFVTSCASSTLSKSPNRPFPSSCLSRFRSESWCSTIEKEISLICIRIRNSFPFEWLCTRTRFDTEACSNSEMGYWNLSPIPQYSLFIYLFTRSPWAPHGLLYSFIYLFIWGGGGGICIKTMNSQFTEARFSPKSN